MIAKRNRHEKFRGGHSQYSWQVADRRGSRVRARRGLPAPQPREVSFHLRLCDFGRDRVEGE